MEEKNVFVQRFVVEYGFVPEVLRQWASMLERDYWGNLSLVIDEMYVQVKHLQKMREGYSEE